MKQEFYSVKEFAKILKVHPNTVRKAIREKRIHSFKTNPSQRGVHRIPVSEISRMLDFDLDIVLEAEVEKRIRERGFLGTNKTGT